jgi:carbon starvation protein CstA
MKSKGYRISKVKKEMIKKYDLDENEFNEIIDRIKSKSKYTILYGFFLVVLGVWNLITTFYPFNLFFSIAFIILGVWAITQGYKKKHIDK